MTHILDQSKFSWRVRVAGMKCVTQDGVMSKQRSVSNVYIYPISLKLELDKYFDDVRNWMFLNKLEINDEKTEIM